MKLNAHAFGLAIGVTWAIGIFVVSLTTMWFGYGEGFIDLFETIYIGYSPTVVGAFIGAVWALVDGYIGGAVIVWFYNKFSK